MNDKDIEICNEIISVLNNAKFELTTPEMVMTARKIEAFAQMIARAKKPKDVKEVKDPIKKG